MLERCPPPPKPADIVFVLAAKPHPMFSREGDDLIMTYRVPLRCGPERSVPCVSDASLFFSVPVCAPVCVGWWRGGEGGLSFPPEPWVCLCVAAFLPVTGEADLSLWVSQYQHTVSSYADLSHAFPPCVFLFFP